MSRQRASWEDEERWSPEDEKEARYEAAHVWPGASFDCSDEATKQSLLDWLDNLDNKE